MRVFATLLALTGLVYGLADTDTITWGGDNSRTGYQTNHNMDPAVVGSAQFGQLFRTRLPGAYNGAKENVFSQPLVYTPSGGDGRQYVYIATTQNNVYKLDGKTGEILLSKNLHIPFLTADLDGCTDINPLVGITATGVIDPETDTLYLTAKTYANQNGGNGAQGRPAGRVFLHALDVNDLSERPNFPVDLEGTVARNNPARSFGGGIHLQRPALLHTRDFIYAGFASHCVKWNFTGWIMGWDKTTGETVERYAMEGEGVSVDTEGGGIWMSGGGLSSDNAGSIFYATGNGKASQLATVPVAGFNPPTALEEAAVHMTMNDDGSLQVVDFFMPWEKQALDGDDKDLGTSPLELLPKEFACGNHKRLGVVTGKSGKTYFLDLDDLGGYRMGSDGLDDVIQVYQNPNSVYAGAGVYPLEGGYIYINVVQHPSNVFKFSCNDGKPAFTKVAETPVANGYILGVGHGTVTSLDGQPGTGLLWITDVEGANLRIYDAVPKDGTMTLVNSFSVPGSQKFGRPVFGDGTMYQCSNQGYVHGFGSPINMPIECDGTLDFGDVELTVTSESKTVTCTATIDLTLTGVAIGDGSHFSISNAPTTPRQLTKGSKFTVDAAFKPAQVGFLSVDIVFNSTNAVQGYSERSTTRLSGTGESAAALLNISPNGITFPGIITGSNTDAVVENIQLSNRGNSPLTVTSIDYSTESGNGPFETFTGSGTLVVGKFTISNIPKTVAANTGATLDVKFDASASGTYSAFLMVKSDGGNKLVSMAASAGPAPITLIEFQTIDGSDWVEYKRGEDFTFGNVTENTSRSLRMRVTNAAPKGAVRLYLTISKAPVGGSGLIRAVNQVDLGEGTSLGPGENATAVLTCSSAKRQWNTDAKNDTVHWTMNTNEEAFDKAEIGFFCNSVAEQAPPLLEDGEGQFRYLGCFKENNPGRQLQTQLFGNDQLTNAMCIEACAERGFTFCATQYHRECWGGNKIPSEKSDEINCNYFCSGDVRGQTCGGNGEGDGSGSTYLSLFADSLTFDGNYTRPGDDGNGGGNNGGGGGGGGTTPKPVANPGAAGYKHIGCYTEATTGRALSHEEKPEVKAVEPCITACAASKYTYAGLEYGGECWCGNSFGTGAVPAAAADCNIACNGNKTELCGGGSRLNVYQFDDGEISTSVPVTETSSSTIASEPETSTTAATTTTSEPPKPTQTGPSKTESIGDYAFEGCWTESTTGRALSGKTYASDDMTLDSCADYCDGFTYFGVEYGRECYCGNTLGAGSVKATNQNDCNFKCAGNPLQYCGAGVRLELYKLASSATSTTSSASETESSASSSIVASTSSTLVTSTTRTSASATPTGPIIDPGNRNFTFYSCVSEPSSGRLFDRQIYNDGDNMTIDSCLERCWDYQWAGVEYGRECWCGDVVKWAGNTGATAGKNVTSSECNIKCSGDNLVYCGGSSRMSLYTRKDEADIEDDDE